MLVTQKGQTGGQLWLQCFSDRRLQRESEVPFDLTWEAGGGGRQGEGELGEHLAVSTVGALGTLFPFTLLAAPTVLITTLIL